MSTQSNLQMLTSACSHHCTQERRHSLSLYIWQHK